MKNTVFDNINPAVLERVQNLRLIDDELMTVVFSGQTRGLILEESAIIRR